VNEEIPRLVAALADRAESLCFALLPGGKIVAGEFTASGADTGFGSIGVVLKGGKRGRVGFWAGRPDNPTKDGGDLLHLIMATQGLQMRDAITWANDWLGGAAVAMADVPKRQVLEKSEAEIAEWKRKKAVAMFEAAQPVRDHTPAIASAFWEYLGHRGIALHFERLSNDVRFAPRLEYWRGATRTADGRRQPGPAFPAIVCAIRQPDGRQTAVHCTFLSRMGRSKAPVEKPKLMMGEVKGGTICLQEGKPGDPQILLEGVEDGLTAMMAAGLNYRIEAVTSLANLRHAPLPKGCPLRIICPDNDWHNQAAMAAYARAWDHLAAAGVPMREVRATGGAKDLNDMVKK
jgi:hypothetical protein